MAREFIYHMRGLSKTYPAATKVLENINLSFYPDAKIGVLGVNGSGKSTLLRIMAGIDKECTRRRLGRRGRARRLPAAGAAARSGEERARERHGGRGGEEGDPRPLQRARHELFGRDRRRDDRAPGRDRGQGPVGPRLARSSRRWTRSRCPPDDWPVDTPVGRRAAPRRAMQAPARAARAAAARRADQPSRRRDRGLARRPSAQLSGRDPDRHPRPLLPRQRHRLDPRARSRPRHSLRGQLLVLARCRSRSAWRRKAARRNRASARIAREQEWVAGLAEGAAGEVEGPHPALRGPRREGRRERRRRRRRSSSRSPSGSARTSSSSTGSRRASPTSCSSTSCRSSCRPAASSA